MRLYYGTFEPDMTAYLDQEKEWSEQNVKVINVYSNDKEYYVQDAFSKVTACHGRLSRASRPRLHDTDADNRRCA